MYKYKQLQMQILIQANKNANIYNYKQCGVRRTICNLNICGTSSNLRHSGPKAVDILRYIFEKTLMWVICQISTIFVRCLQSPKCEYGVKRDNLVSQHTYQYSSTKTLRQRRRRRCWGKVADVLVFGDALSPITASIEQPNVFWWEGWTRWMRRVETCRLPSFQISCTHGHCRDRPHRCAQRVNIIAKETPQTPTIPLLRMKRDWIKLPLFSSAEINLPPGLRASGVAGDNDSRLCICLFTIALLLTIESFECEIF